MAKHNETGAWGEQLAVDKLVADGCSILETNWRTKGFEIDIVARKDNIVIFAEVKTRRDKDEDPLEAIDARKISKMTRAADLYLSQHDLPWEPRFDLFGIRGVPEDYQIEHIPDAFLPPLRKY